MTEPISIVLAGMGGYGTMYLKALLDGPDRERCRLVGTVDPFPDRCLRRSDLESLKIPNHASLDDFYRVSRADLAILVSPIHLHARQTCLALDKGSHVLCEKPAASTVQDVDRMIEARDRAGRFVAVGFQWSFTEPITRLKADIASGVFGRARRIKSLCLWPRDESYYSRNSWAGRTRGGQGEWILDSPVSNAMAHDLHNMLFLLGEKPGESARPASVEAELYRAKEIENCDTAALRVKTEDGVEILFFASHAVAEDRGPVFSIEFDRAVVEYAGGPAPIRARLDDGEAREYSSPDSEPHFRKLEICLDAVRACRGQKAAAVPCGLEAARAHTLCMNGAHDSCPEPFEFPEDLLHSSGAPGHRHVWVEDLGETLMHCFDRNALPSENGVPWAMPGREIDLRGYDRFPCSG